MTQPLQLERCADSLLLIHIQTRTMLNDDAANVVLQVEQVLYVLGHMCPTGAELWAREVASGLKVPVPCGILLVPDREQSDRRVSEALLAHGSECHMHHLLNGIVDLVSDDGSCPRCRGVDGYLHPDLTIVQAMGLKRTAAVDGNRPIVAEANECAQQHSQETQAVLARGTKLSVLAEGAVGVVHVHLQTQTMNTLLTPKVITLESKYGKTAIK
jgi:hypothetical protein